MSCIGYRKILDSEQNPEQRAVGMDPLRKLQVLGGEGGGGKPIAWQV